MKAAEIELRILQFLEARDEGADWWDIYKPLQAQVSHDKASRAADQLEDSGDIWIDPKTDLYYATYRNPERKSEI